MAKSKVQESTIDVLSMMISNLNTHMVKMAADLKRMEEMIEIIRKQKAVAEAKAKAAKAALKQEGVGL